jgi:hypothetical protein
MNKKKSKSKWIYKLINCIVCCIYEKPNKDPDVNDDKDSSSCSSSEDDERNKYDKPPKH